ncbi:MAG: hypothetical protein ACOZAK_02425 [Patescibacteria group bacterium]
MKNKRSVNLLFFCLFIVSFFYSVFSYSLTDPNLIISSWQPYWHFQLWMWQTFFKNTQLLTISYLGLVLSFFIIYLVGLKFFGHQKQPITKKIIIKFLIAFSPLLFSYNALSHDVFNYIFNAKMVTLFKANPHIKTALDFYYDDWTRFMHNTHTPAPYGYGWTIFSVIPYLAGFHKFLSSWFIFKLLAWVSYYLLFLTLTKFSEKLTNKKLTLQQTWLIFANPLLVIEILSNLHNDLWMLVPAIAALNMVIDKPKKYLVPKAIISLLLLAFSISTKLATITLIPFWFYWFGKWFIHNHKIFTSILSYETLFPSLISITLFLPLLTERSKMFLPWYLIWSLIWLGQNKLKFWQNWLLALSLTALLRYLPWLLAGGFTELVENQQKILVWGGGLTLFIVFQLVNWLKKPTSRN